MKSNWLLIAAGLSSSFFINSAVRIPVIEVFALIFFVVYNHKIVQFYSHKKSLITLIALVVVSTSMIVSGYVNSTDPFLVAKASVNWFAPAILVPFYAYLFGNQKSLIQYLFWSAMSAIIYTVIGVVSNQISLSDPLLFKKSLSSLAIFLVALVGSHISRPYLSTKNLPNFIGSLALFYYFEFRSLSLSFILALFFSASPFLKKGFLNKKNIKIGVIMICLIIVVSIFYGLFFPALLTTTTLPFLSYFGPLLAYLSNLFVTDRVYVFGSLRAAFDKPLLGHGPWAVDVDFTYHEFMQNLISGYVRVTEGNWITVHSLISSAWVWGGLLGLIGIIFLAYQFIKIRFSLNLSSLHEGIIFPLNLLFAMTLWDFIASPPGSIRSLYSVCLGFMFAKLYQKKLLPTNLRT